jgi:hypothetical protein
VLQYYRRFKGDMKQVRACPQRSFYGSHGCHTCQSKCCVEGKQLICLFWPPEPWPSLFGMTLFRASVVAFTR